MIDNEFERKGREMSDKLNQIVDLEYTWGDFPALTAEQIYKAYDARAVCAQVTTCNGAAILALEKRIAELERERDAANKRARTAELDALALADWINDDSAQLKDIILLVEKWLKASKFDNDQLREELEARAERDEVIADARRLAKIAKNVHFVSESENNLIEKYAK